MHNRCKTKCNPVHVGKQWVCQQTCNLRLCKTNFIQWYIDIYVCIYEEWQTQTWQTSAGENSVCHIKKIYPWSATVNFSLSSEVTSDVLYFLSAL